MAELKTKMTLNQAAEILKEANIESPLHDAREIFRHIGGMSSGELVFRDAICDNPEVENAVRLRAKRYPLQYIIGSVDFYRESYTVTPDCLIPRSDTELLVDYAVKNLPSGAHFIDLCTGSGCVAVSTLKNTVNTTATAVDISRGALEVAKKNAKRNSVENRISFVELDVTKGSIDEPFFALLSNPPYVTVKDYNNLEKEIFCEPKIAFLGGDDGMDFYRIITETYKDRLDAGGFIAYEIGYDQKEAIKDIAKKCHMTCEILKDLAGNDRVAILKKQ